MLLFVAFKKKKAHADFILISLLGLFTLLYGFIYYTQEYGKDHLTAYLLNVSLLLAAIFVIYTQKLLERKPGLSIYHLLHFAPFVICSLFLYTYFFFEKYNNPKISSLYDFIQEFRWIHSTFNYINIAIGPIYLLIIAYLFKKHRNNILQVFSSTEKVEIRWVKDIAIVAFMLWLITALIGKVGKIYFYPQLTSMYQITWGLSSLLFVYISYKGIKHRSIFFDLPEETENVTIQAPAKYSRSGLKEVAFEPLAQKLKTYVETNKPYLNPQITIYELATNIETPPYQVSQLLNEYFKMNFFDFINYYRVEEFKKQVFLPENKNYSIQSVAFDCGFNSKTTFYRIFKEHTKLTPSQYINSAGEQNK
jgi:AraC-like DNA-binding protein